MRKLLAVLAAAALMIVSCVTIETGTKEDGTQYTKTKMSGQGTVTIDVKPDGTTNITGEAEGISDQGAGLIGGVLGDLGGSAASVFGGNAGGGDTIVNVSGGEVETPASDSD